jgi:rhodanese-related sulfurtransferase
MNTKALQKRISEGNIFPHRETGEWPCCEMHAKTDSPTEEEVTVGSADARRNEYAACHIPDRRVEVLRQVREVMWSPELPLARRRPVRVARGA